MRKFLVSALALGLAAGSAQAFTAINGLTVTPVQGGFEVVTRGADGPRQIWCAAGEYARQIQGAGGNDRLYILRGYGASLSESGKRGVVFTLHPDPDVANGPRPGTGGNYSVSMRDVGYNLRTAHAEQFCADVFEDVWPF